MLFTIFTFFCAVTKRLKRIVCDSSRRKGDNKNSYINKAFINGFVHKYEKSTETCCTRDLLHCHAVHNIHAFLCKDERLKRIICDSSRRKGDNKSSYITTTFINTRVPRLTLFSMSPSTRARGRRQKINCGSIHARVEGDFP